MLAIIPVTIGIAMYKNPGHAVICAALAVPPWTSRTCIVDDVVSKPYAAWMAVGFALERLDAESKERDLDQLVRDCKLKMSRSLTTVDIVSAKPSDPLVAMKERVDITTIEALKALKAWFDAKALAFAERRLNNQEWPSEAVRTDTERHYK